MSDAHVLYHGDELKVASHKFSLHIHPRLETCTECEPGCCTTTTSAAATSNTGQIHVLLLLLLLLWLLLLLL